MFICMVDKNYALLAYCEDYKNDVQNEPNYNNKISNDKPNQSTRLKI